MSQILNRRESGLRFPRPQDSLVGQECLQPCSRVERFADKVWLEGIQIRPPPPPSQRIPSGFHMPARTSCSGITVNWGEAPMEPTPRLDRTLGKATSQARGCSCFDLGHGSAPAGLFKSLVRGGVGVSMRWRGRLKRGRSITDIGSFFERFCQSVSTEASLVAQW